MLESKQPPAVTRLAARAVRLEGLVGVGILPRSGGWDEQDWVDIYLIDLATEVRSTREAVKARQDKARADRQRK